MDRRVRMLAVLAVPVAASAALYLRAGLAQAYLAADDFQWLEGGRAFVWSRLSQQVVGDHSYRPVVDVWFAAAVAGCGPSTPCYHLLSLALHLLAVALVGLLALSLFDDFRIALWGALFFALEPGYTQAVVWVSAATTLLATCFYVSALVAQAASWKAATRVKRSAFEIAAVALSACALFSHEATMTLPAVSWIMWKQFGPEDLLKRRALVSGFVLAVGVFVVMTALANYRNTVFTESHYAIGLHVFPHAFAYFVALYVGPGSWFAYFACTVAIALLLAATPATRFGALWLLVTVLPYVGFTWGNVSRYLYLPSIGFALAVAAALVAAGDWLSHRRPDSGRLVQAGVLAVALFVALRFAKFDDASIRSQVQSLELWRDYAIELATDAAPDAGRILVTRLPSGELVDVMYVAPMLRWVYQDFTSEVVMIAR